MLKQLFAMGIGLLSYFVNPTDFVNPADLLFKGVSERYATSSKIAYADKIDDRTKWLFNTAKEYRKQGRHDIALTYFLAIERLHTFDDLIGVLIEDSSAKLKTHKVFIEDFQNSSDDPTLAKRLQAMLRKINFDGIKVTDERAKAKFVVDGEVLSYRVDKNESTYQRTIRYVSGDIQVDNPEYIEAQRQLWIAQQNYAKASGDAPGGTLGEGVNIIYSGKAYEQSRKAKDTLGQLASIANGLQSLGNIAALSDAKNEVNAAMARFASLSPTINQKVHELYTSNETTVTKEGLLEYKVRVSYNDKILFDDVMTAHVQFKDTTIPEFMPAKIRGDPLNIGSDLQLREATLAAAALSIGEIDIFARYLNNLVDSIPELNNDEKEYVKKRLGELYF